MNVNEPVTRELLRRLVRTITANPALWDDLFQEALIHLWGIESRRPGFTRSWYLQSCKYHLRHYLAAGRSIDSMKRREMQVQAETESDPEMELYDLEDSGESVLSHVCAREVITMLSRQLLPPEKAVLDCLADGMGPREIGRRLNISHTMVIKHRCKIASLLSRLERNQNGQWAPSRIRAAAPGDRAGSAAVFQAQRTLEGRSVLR
jgi:RNA polymerase sigma factor (sigma-70 family)